MKILLCQSTKFVIKISLNLLWKRTRIVVKQGKRPQYPWKRQQQQEAMLFLRKKFSNDGMQGLRKTAGKQNASGDEWRAQRLEHRENEIEYIRIIFCILLKYKFIRFFVFHLKRNAKNKRGMEFQGKIEKRKIGKE